MVKIWHGNTVKSCKIGCNLLDIDTGQCSNYIDRQQHVPNCVKITLSNIDDIGLLPNTCAYKLIKNGNPLKSWHYLISGSKQSVIDAGISIVGLVTTIEDNVRLINLHNYIIKDS